MPASSPEVVIVGAGPYALSVACHLRGRGVAFRMFGPTMSFWAAMPAGIHLKSLAFGTSIVTPEPGFGFPEYCRAHGLEDFEPCTMASYTAYGRWLQATLVPEVEPHLVTAVREAGGRFSVRLSSGVELRARCVVVATGLSHFAYVPPVLARLPAGFVTHTADLDDFSTFAGRDVAVVGAGASALEAAAMVHEAGGRPVVLARGDEVVFHTRFDAGRSLLERWRSPMSVLGPGRKSLVMEKLPMLLHYVPEGRRVRFTRNYLGPAAPWWLAERFHGKVAVRVRARVDGAEVRGDRVVLQVSEAGGPARATEFDHVVAGTGYDPNVDRLPMLDAGLKRRVRRVEGAAALSRAFESSVRGLYFVGPAAALSFGPLFRFVAGAAYAAPTVARHVAARVRG